MTTNVEKSYRYYKSKYEGEVMDKAASFTKLQQLSMHGVQIVAQTQPTYENGTVSQEFTVSYEGDSFSFTYVREPYPSELQQFGWE